MLQILADQPHKPYIDVDWNKVQIHMCRQSLLLMVGVVNKSDHVCQKTRSNYEKIKTLKNKTENLHVIFPTYL